MGTHDSSDSTRRELLNEYQNERVKIVFNLKKSLRPCALDKNSLSIRRVNIQRVGYA